MPKVKRLLVCDLITVTLMPAELQSVDLPWVPARMFHHTEDNSLSWLHKEISTRRCAKRNAQRGACAPGHTKQTQELFYMKSVCDELSTYILPGGDRWGRDFHLRYTCSLFSLNASVTGWGQMIPSLSSLLVIRCAEYDLYFLRVGGRSSLVLYM